MSGGRADGHQPWMDYVPPVFEGPLGKVWRLAPDFPGDPTAEVFLGSWLVFAPTAHPAWNWHVVSGVELRDVAGVPPAKRHYPEAEFELLVMAFTPDNPPPDPRSARPVEGVLSPPDACTQFHGVTREQAVEIVELAARACTTGLLVPDSDHRRRWDESIATTVQHYQAGMH